jgi:hypothetical protein
MLKFLAKWFLKTFVPHIEFIKTVDGVDSIYMRRYYVWHSNKFNIFIHEFLGSDPDQDPHSHPWTFSSYILSGRYEEQTWFYPRTKPNPKLCGYWAHQLFAGDLVHRTADHIHRVELTHGPAWTLVFTGPRIKEWFFYTKKGPVQWQEYQASSLIKTRIRRGNQ